MTRGRQRANGEGSIFPYRNGYAAYVWVTTPDGKRRRKWVYGKTRQDVHGKWLKLHDSAGRGPVPTISPTLAEYMAYWLHEVVVPPDYAPLTCATYETLTRLYVLPGLGSKRLDKLTLRDVRSWLNKLRDTCQCCAQGKDARRSEKQRRCCAKVPAVCYRRLQYQDPRCRQACEGLGRNRRQAIPGWAHRPSPQSRRPNRESPGAGTNTCDNCQLSETRQ
jgi:hypothetical protein